MERVDDVKLNFAFWFHLFITFLAVFGWFMFSWWLMAIAYTIVMLQFFVFDRCVLNAEHDLHGNEDSTFYSFLFESIGLNIPRKPLKNFVRKFLYPILGVLAFFWQSSEYGLGIAPLFF